MSRYVYGRSKTVVPLIDRAELKAWNAMNRLARESYWAEENHRDASGAIVSRSPAVMCRMPGCQRKVRIAVGICDGCIKKTTREARKKRPRQGLSTETYAQWRRRLGHAS